MLLHVNRVHQQKNDKHRHRLNVTIPPHTQHKTQQTTTYTLARRRAPHIRQCTVYRTHYGAVKTVSLVFVCNTCLELFIVVRLVLYSSISRWTVNEWLSSDRDTALFIRRLSSSELVTIFFVRTDLLICSLFVRIKIKTHSVNSIFSWISPCFYNGVGGFVPPFVYCGEWNFGFFVVHFNSVLFGAHLEPTFVAKYPLFSIISDSWLQCDCVSTIFELHRVVFHSPPKQKI